MFELVGGFLAGGGGGPPSCYRDGNGSGTLSVADAECVQGEDVLGDLYADCNADGQLTVTDFGWLQTRFVIGCP